MVDPFNMVAPEASQDSGLKPDVTEFNALTCELEYTRRPVQKLPCLPKASSMFLPESINPTGNHRKIVSNSTLTILALDSELLIITGSEGKLSSFPMKSTVVEISLHPSKNLLACILLEGVMVVLDLDKMEEKERKEEKCSRIIWLQGMKFATYYGSKISYWQMVGNGYTLSKTRECGTTLHDFCIPDETVACVILANGKFQIRSTETSANEILYELEVSQAQLATIRPGYFLLLESGKITLWNTEQQKFTSMLTISDSNGLKCINWVNEADLLVLTHTNSPRVTFLYLDSISFRYAVEYSLEDNTIGAAARFARSNKSGELMNQDCEIEVIGIHGENLTNYKINYGALFPCLANDYVPTAAGLIVTEEIKEEMEDKGYETTLFRPIPTVFNQLLHSPSVDEATPQVTSPPETITPPIALPSMTPVITPPYQEPPKETTPILPPIQPTTPPKPSEDQAPKEPLKHLPSSATGSDSNISPRPKPKKVAPPINERQIEKKLEQAQRKIEQNIQTKLQEQMNMLQEHMNSFGSQIKTTIGNEIKIQFQTYVLPKLDETIQLQSGQMKSKFENSVLELGERSDERWGVIEQITKHFKSSVEVLIDINKGISSALDTRKESESSKSESPAAEPQTLEQRVISLLQAQKFEDGINLALEDTTILLKVLGWIEANSLLSGNFLSNDTFWALLETLLGLADDSSSLAMDWLEQLSFHIQIRKEDGPRLDAIIQQLYAWTGEGKTKIWEIRMRLISKFPE